MSSIVLLHTTNHDDDDDAPQLPHRCLFFSFLFFPPLSKPFPSFKYFVVKSRVAFSFLTASFSLPTSTYRSLMRRLASSSSPLAVYKAPSRMITLVSSEKSE